MFFMLIEEVEKKLRYKINKVYFKIQDKGQMIHKRFESNKFLNKNSLNIV